MRLRLGAARWFRARLRRRGRLRLRRWASRSSLLCGRSAGNRRAERLRRPCRGRRLTVGRQRGDRLRARRNRRHRAHDGRERSGKVGTCRNRGFERPSARGRAGGRHHLHCLAVVVVDVRDVGDVVDRRVVRHAVDRGVLHAHADVVDRRRADDHRRRRTDRGRHDQAEPRTGRRGNEHARWPDRSDPCHHAGCRHRHCKAQPQRRRHERDARRRPMACDEDHHVVAVLVVRLHPSIAGLRGRGPAACGPHPVALPRPVAAGPHRARERRGRRHFHEHRRRSPCHRDRRRLIQRRIDVHAHDRRCGDSDVRGLHDGADHRSRRLNDTACSQAHHQNSGNLKCGERRRCFSHSIFPRTCTNGTGNDLTGPRKQSMTAPR